MELNRERVDGHDLADLAGVAGRAGSCSRPPWRGSSCRRMATQSERRSGRPSEPLSEQPSVQRSGGGWSRRGGRGRSGGRGRRGGGRRRARTGAEDDGHHRQDGERCRSSGSLQHPLDPPQHAIAREVARWLGRAVTTVMAGRPAGLPSSCTVPRPTPRLTRRRASSGHHLPEKAAGTARGLAEDYHPITGVATVPIGQAGPFRDRGAAPIVIAPRPERRSER